MTTLKKYYPLALLYGFLTLVPLIIYIACIQQNAVNIPIADEWTLIELRLKAAADSVSWQDIFALHNEHRIASLRLISLGLDRLSTGWNSTLRMVIGGVINIFTFLVLLVLSWRQLRASSDSAPARHALHLFGITTVATALLFFCPSQYENWLSGFQIPWFLINLILIATAFLLYEFFKHQRIVYYLAAVCLSFLASFSLAQGLFIWVACLPIFWTRGLKTKVRFTFLSAWLMSTIVAFLAYMAGYSKPSGHPSTSLVLENPGAAIDFFFNLLGNAFGRGGSSDFVLGLLMFTTFLGLTFFCYRQEEKVWNDAVVWFAIGLFPLMFTVITTTGRLGLGSGAALASRYATVTLLLPICLVQLVRIVIQNTSNTSKSIRFLMISFLLSGFLLASVVDGYQNGLSDARATMHSRHRGKACLELYKYFEPDFLNQCIATYIFPAPAIPLELVQELHNEGIIALSPVISSGNHQQTAGQFDEINLISGDSETIFSARGWVFSNGNPGVVLLSTNGGQSFFSVTEINKRRRDIARAYSDRYLQSGWEETVSLEQLNIETEFLTAYFYDFQTRELVRIGQKLLPTS